MVALAGRAGKWWRERKKLQKWLAQVSGAHVGLEILKSDEAWEFDAMFQRLFTSNVGKAEPRTENQRVLMKVLDEHDVAVHLIHLGIEDPTAIRRDRKTPIEILV